MENAMLIIGDSPFLGDIQKEIHYAVEKYPAIGINHAVENYNVCIHAFQDIKFVNITNKYPSIKTVAPAWYGDMIQKENKELIGSYPFILKEDTADDIVKDGKLAWCGFTHDYVISYCIMKGCKNIVLVGAADFTGNSYCHNSDENFKYSEKLKEQSKEFISKVCTQKANIYTCNPDSILDVPRINIQNLLN